MAKLSLEELDRFEDRVNMVLLIDHGGRAGSNFFQCLFDTHQSVVVSPLVHYVYSYWQRVFGDQSVVSGSEGHSFVSVVSYSRLLYQDPLGDIRSLIVKIGGDPQAPFDRREFRSLIDQMFEGKTNVTRKQVVLWTYAAYALVRGYPLDGVKLIGVNDAVSLGEENMIVGFSGVALEKAAADFPNLINIALVRDPRAQFASTRHQMLNEFGNNYSISPETWWDELSKLRQENISLEHGPAHFCSFYQYAAFYTLLEKWKERDSAWYFLKNEDINTNFVPTMKALCEVLDVEPDSAWVDEGENYTVTMLGMPWAGTGAYNSRYQQVQDGPIANDSDAISSKVIGPNKYVTERWKSRIPKSEKLLLECLFYEEIIAFGYDFLELEGKQPEKIPSAALWLFYSGEVAGFKWVFLGRDKLSRLFYLISFLPFYVVSRIKMKNFYNNKRFFSRLGNMNFFHNKSQFIRARDESE